MNYSISRENLFLEVLDDLGVDEGISYRGGEKIRRTSGLEPLDEGLSAVYLEEEREFEGSSATYVLAVLDGLDVQYDETMPEEKEEVREYFEERDDFEEPVRFGTPF
ncbi:MAG: hypothetical protein ABEK04_05370 [Candidatus Nanohalobium sp.]